MHRRNAVQGSKEKVHAVCAQEALTVTGLAAGDLAYEGARRLLDEHQRMLLSGADRDAFLAAMDRKPDPAPRLVEALKRHRHLLG